jgi:very-short-patch-repair endonuclease
VAGDPDQCRKMAKKIWKDPKHRARMHKILSEVGKKNCQNPNFRKAAQKAWEGKLGECRRKEQADRMREIVNSLWQQKWFQKLRSESSSECTSEHWVNDREYKKACMSALRKIHKSRIGTTLPKEWKDNLLKALEKFKKRPEYRAKKRKQMIKQWQDPDFVKTIRPKTSAVHLDIFQQILDAGFIGFEKEYHIGTYLLDIVNPHKKIDIEVDGYFGHHTREGKLARRRRDYYLRCQGWKVLHIKARRHEGEKAIYWLKEVL